MNRESYPVVFQYDPFVGVYECFKELFPDKDAEIWWQYDLTDGDGGKVLGVTTFPDDGSLPQVLIDCDQSVNDSIQILAHELSHVATDGEGHGKDFYDAYNAIWQMYHKKMGLIAPKDFELGSEDDEHKEVQDGPIITPCRGCSDYDGYGGCKSKGGCAREKMEVQE